MSIIFYLFLKEIMIIYRYKTNGLVVIMKLSEKVKQLRVNNNMTQRELAQKLGVSIPTLQKYEYGTLRLRNEMIIKICNIFNISINNFLKDTNEYRHTNLYDEIIIDEMIRNRVSLSNEINEQNVLLIELLEKLGFEIQFNTLNTEVTIFSEKFAFDTKYDTFKFIQILNMLENDLLINLKKYDEILKSPK